MSATVITMIEREKITLLNDLHHKCETSYRRTLVYAIEAGKVLLSIKQELQHGEWTDWLADNFDGSDRTARVYMQLADVPEIEKRQTSADLSIAGALKEVSKPGKPRPMSTSEMGDAFRGQTASPEIPPESDGNPSPPSPAFPDRKDRRAGELLDEIRALYEQAHQPNLLPSARAQVYKSAATKAGLAAAALDDVAIALGF